MRIISGTARGRKIDTPAGLSTRPTLDRVKESVFGSIQFEIEGRVVLDLFAGSGNLGIEALSRGAKYAVFCDSSRVCADIVSANLKKTGFTNAEVINSDFEQVLLRLKSIGQKFDLVFLDPPYASGLVQPATDMLCDLGLLSSFAIIVAEHSVNQKITIPDALSLRSEKKYRDTAVTMLEMKNTLDKGQVK